MSLGPRTTPPLLKSLLPFAIAFAAYTALAIVYTWPLATKPGTHLPHDLGDPLISSWLLWWHQWVVPFTETWWTGLAFYPVGGTLAFSDHRVGLMLIALPVQWLGGNEVTAYNVAYILSFSLSATAAHLLVHALTRGHLESLVAGLVFGFNPFRLGHVSHLEIVSSYWLPIILLGLHLWLRTRRLPWLVLAAVAYLVQALTCGYYLFYAVILVVAWAVWFLRGAVARVAIVGGVFAAACVPLIPVLLEYRRVHEYFDLRRPIWEIEMFSADVTGLLSGIPWLAGVAWFDGLSKSEGSIFPGLAAVAVVVTAGVDAMRRSGIPKVPRSTLRLACLVAAALSALVALSPLVFGPWRLALGPVRLSVTAVHKPLTLVVLLLALYAGSSQPVLEAWRRRSVFAFYALATLGFWLLSFGPSPTIFEQRWLYKAPYSWLMFLPGFDTGLRAPARFAMVAALCLAVAAGVGLQRLLRDRSPRARAWIAAVLAALVFMDSRPLSFPVVRVPNPPEWPASIPADAVALELPLGGAFEDAIAVYDSTVHGRRVVNGLSGYDPAHYVLLRTALEQDDPAALEALAQRATISVAVRAEHDRWRQYLARLQHVQTLGSRDGVDFYLVAKTPRPQTPAGARLAIREVSASASPQTTALMIDGNLATSWDSDAPQRGDEQVTVDLSAASSVCEVRLSQGPSLGVPEMLAIDADWGEGWQPVWSGPTAGRAMSAALDDPRRIETPFAVPLQTREVRRLRLRQTGVEKTITWSIAELQVFACGGAQVSRSVSGPS